jgi:calcium-dependent protein kinase
MPLIEENIERENEKYNSRQTFQRKSSALTSDLKNKLGLEADEDRDMPKCDTIKIKAKNFLVKNSTNPGDSYERISFLGEGGFSKVLKVQSKVTKEMRAMKIIKKQGVNLDLKDANIFDEINILKTLDHPNIIKIYEFFEDERNFYLITEFCEFGDLFENLINADDELNPFFTESISCFIMKQLLSAITYLHDQNIIHGDLKLENILVDNKINNQINSNNSKGVEIKIIDFGCSKFFNKKIVSSDNINGTVNYIAPEALQGIINKKNDIWSCGVIMYILLSGEMPFQGKSDDETINSIESGEVKFKSSVFNNVSAEAKDLIKQLLTFDYNKRIDANHALKHKWFKIKLLQEKEVDKSYKFNIMSNLKNFKAEHKFQQAVYTYITHNLVAKEEIEGLRKIFKQLDADGNGKISKDELQRGFQESIGSILGELEMKALMKSIDQDNNGYIEYEEFIQAALGSKALLTHDNLIQAFNVFDIDKSGDITTEEFRKIIGGEEGVDDGEFQAFLKQIDLKSGESMTFEKFKSLMKKMNVKSSKTTILSKKNSL